MDFSRKADWVKEIRRLVWVTDPHLNFVKLPEWESWTAALRESGADAILLTGDISESEDVGWQLRRLKSDTQLPIYFVLGNHDFYHGSISAVRASLREVCSREAGIVYLTASEPRKLCSGWVLCGDDGWADARIGSYEDSPVQMNDSNLIEDLSNLAPGARKRVLEREGVAAAVRLRKQLNAAKQTGQRILVLTHVPPFRESCWYEGHHANNDWAPFFTCHAVGWMLKRFCANNPEVDVLVLCGHTHEAGRAQIASNLFVWTGGADYGQPQIAAVLDLEQFQYPAADWTYATG